MTPEEKIAHLERQLQDTRRAAVHLVLGLVQGVVETPEGRNEVADSLEQETEGGDVETARLARVVAAKLREDVSR